MPSIRIALGCYCVWPDAASLCEVHALQNHSLSFDVLLRWLVCGCGSWYCCLLPLVLGMYLFIWLMYGFGNVCAVGGMVGYDVGG